MGCAAGACGTTTRTRFAGDSCAAIGSHFRGSAGIGRKVLAFRKSVPDVPLMTKMTVSSALDCTHDYRSLAQQNIRGGASHLNYNRQQHPIHTCKVSIHESGV
jgi:hypothetical protein